MKVATEKTDKAETISAYYTRAIPLPTPEQKGEEAIPARVSTILPNKVPLHKLQAIWNDESVTYTEEELFRIREWLYVMAEVTIIEFERHQRSIHIVPLTQHTTSHTHTSTTPPNEVQKSHSIRPRIYRRAS